MCSGEVTSSTPDTQFPGERLNVLLGLSSQQSIISPVLIVLTCPELQHAKCRAPTARHSYIMGVSLY